MNTILASAAFSDAFAVMPWWGQILTGMALLFGGLALGKLNKHKDFDSPAILIVECSMKVVGVVCILFALF